METLTATSSVLVDAKPSTVWAGITDPALITKIFFGARVETDWREGSPITFSGEWEGRPYVDKGEILRIEPEKLFQYSYWSPLSGTGDTPENYATITFRLVPGDGGTELTVSQDNIAGEAARAQAASNWRLVLDNLKQATEAR
ncbi:MAG TPA: SRPBCC family protein [Pilimelia sp.]|nr:SRPBCC family protein [Pilimelia sp.]